MSQPAVVDDDPAVDDGALAAVLDQLRAVEQRLAVVETAMAKLLDVAGTLAGGVERVQLLVQEVVDGGVTRLLRGKRRGDD